MASSPPIAPSCWPYPLQLLSEPGRRTVWTEGAALHDLDEATGQVALEEAATGEGFADALDFGGV